MDPAQTPIKPDDGPTLAVEPAAPISAAPVSSAPAAASDGVSAAPVSVPPEAGAAPIPEAPKLPADIPSLLEEVSLDGKPPAEAKPDAEKKAEGEAKLPVEVPKVEPPKPVVEATDYFKDVTVPETIKIEDAQRGELNGAFEALRTGDIKAGVQKLIDLHNTTVTGIVEDLGRKQYEVFNDTRTGWRAQIAADAEMGGAGFETTKKAVARMRDLFVPEGDRKEFDEFLRVTGAGDHPAFFRMLHRAARYYDEPRMPPPNPKPPAHIGKRPGSRNPADLYPNTNFAK